MDLEYLSCQPEKLAPETLESTIKSIYDYRCCIAAADHRSLLLGLGVSLNVYILVLKCRNDTQNV